MPSSYATFDVVKRGRDGATTKLAGVQLKIYDATGNASLGTVVTDAGGVVPAGTVNVAAGTLILFRIENYQGMAGSIPQVTT